MDTEYICEQDHDSPKGVIRHTITDAAGNEVLTHERDIFLSREPAIDKQVMTVIDPHLWDTQTPYLYEITTELFIDGERMDSLSQHLGFRAISFDPDKGFFLNRKHVTIHGTCEHHVLGSLGAAMNKTALRRQLLMLKDRKSVV